MFGRKQVRLVEVNFRDLMAAPNLKPGGGYVYTWSLKDDPAEGMRVWVPGSDGVAPAVICKVDAPVPRGYTRAELSAVSRVVSTRELDKARAEWTAQRDKWADAVRRAAGLPKASRLPRRVPEGFPDIPPMPGRGKDRDADKHGKGWWAVYKRADKDGLDADEVQRFRAIAEEWFAIRDRA